MRFAWFFEVRSSTKSTPQVLRALKKEARARPISVASKPNVATRRQRPSRWGKLLKLASPRWGDDHPGVDLHTAPPWLISLLFHMTVLLVFGILLLPDVSSKVLNITAVFSDAIGEQLEETPVELATEEVEEEQVIVEPEPEVVEAPVVNPVPSPIVEDGTTAPVEVFVNDIGSALEGRSTEMKQSLLDTYGGTELTEAAVMDGLEWLKRNQKRDGTWSLRGPYSDGAQARNPSSATAMALLAFLGAGHTTKSGTYRSVVNRGSRALVKMQNSEGDFFDGNIEHHRLYSQGQAMIAICELYGMTKDSQFRTAAERAVSYAVKTQDKLGGWRYQPGFDSDTSVTGWFMMGLQSARMAGINVPEETLERLSEYLDRVSTSDGARYAYQVGMEATYSMTAEALLCRQYLGWPRDDPRMQTGVNLILSRPMRWDDRDVYYWYYATQVLHHLGDERWRRWNETMREILPANQTQRGPERGSWSQTGDRWGPHGGRLYVTCMTLYMLEVYYRHLPLYASVD